MSKKIASTYVRVLQLSIVALTAVLFWFAFVYYPKVISQIKGSKAGFASSFVFKPVSASSNQFPIVTEAYRIEYNQGEQRYYVYVSGNNVTQYYFNRDNARLALKSAASVDDLCTLDVFYISTSGLKAPNKSVNGC